MAGGGEALLCGCWGLATCLMTGVVYRVLNDA